MTGHDRIRRADVEAAAARIGDAVRRTPVLELEAGALGVDVSLVCKLELTQHTGSFKARGATNRLRAAAERGELTSAGVVVASGGNAGLAVAHAAGLLDIPARVYVPTTAPAVKVARLRALGAEVVQEGAEFAEANVAAVDHAERAGAVLVHAYDQPDIVAGQGTLALELLAQVPDLDTVLVAVGGGGLIGGLLAGLDGQARVVGVEPEACPTLHRALAASAPVDVAVGGVAADSLGARRIGELCFAQAQRFAPGSVLVSDRAIVHARRTLWDRCRLAVEHGTAAALAALQAGAYVPAPDERVAVLLCGANTDPADLT